MSIKYVVRKKIANLSTTKKALWYAVAKKFEHVDNRDNDHIAQQIEAHTGFNRHMVKGVLSALEQIVRTELCNGKSVTIDYLGTFQVSVTSEGYEDPRMLTPRRVKVKRVYFTMNKALSQSVKEAGCEPIIRDLYGEDSKDFVPELH